MGGDETLGHVQPSGLQKRDNVSVVSTAIDRRPPWSLPGVTEIATASGCLQNGYVYAAGQLRCSRAADCFYLWAVGIPDLSNREETG